MLSYSQKRADTTVEQVGGLATEKAAKAEIPATPESSSEGSSAKSPAPPVE